MLKNDIKSLPLDALTKEVTNMYNTLLEQRKEELERDAFNLHKRKIQEKVRDLKRFNDSYEGSTDEELEEYARESLGDPIVPELTTEDQDKCLDLAKTNVIKQFLEAFNIPLKYTWVLPQLVTLFGSWKAVKGEDGLYSHRLTYKENVAGNDFNKGAWLLALHPRGELIKGRDVKLYKEGSLCNLVPLILDGFRIYQNIPYSRWSRLDVRWLVEEDLAEAMVCTVPFISSGDLQEIIRFGSIVKEGAKAGTFRDPRWAHKLYGLKSYPLALDTKFVELPDYAQAMVAQIWCAHPSNRTEHMILDPNNWDNMPPALLSSDVIPSPKKANIFKPNNKPKWGGGPVWDA